jgi:hypothetical protein
MNDFDNSGEEVISITRHAFELTMKSQYEAGYKSAIDLLCTKEADNLQEMYASGFAEWLEVKKGTQANA